MVEVGYWKTWCGWSGSIKNLKWLKWVNEKLEVVEVGHWKSWSGWSGSLYMKWLSKQLYIMSEYWQNEVNSWSGWSGWSGLQWVLDAPFGNPYLILCSACKKRNSQFMSKNPSLGCKKSSLILKLIFEIHFSGLGYLQMLDHSKQKV